MTLSKLIEYARYGCALDKYASMAEYEEIHDFFHKWHNLCEKDIEDLKLYACDDNITDLVNIEKTWITK